MYGAIIGDIIGSIYEHMDPPIKTSEFELFTEESTHHVCSEEDGGQSDENGYIPCP